MSTQLPLRSATLTPSTADIKLASASSQQLAKLLGSKKQGSVEIKIQKAGHAEKTLSLPISAMRMLAGVLGEMAQGNIVRVVPEQSEVTTRQAAELLDVSRPFLIKLLDGGQIPFRKVGTHRRVALRDVLAYKQRNYEQRMQALEKLTAQAQELNLGY